jgi:hypothetical protein
MVFMGPYYLIIRFTTRPTGPLVRVHEVRDKLRELHQQVESGLRPRRRYTVGDALDDWLSVGLDGLSARTVGLYRDTIAKALREELGAVRLTRQCETDRREGV